MASYSIGTEDGGRLEMELAGVGGRSAAALLDGAWILCLLMLFFLGLLFLSLLDGGAVSGLFMVMAVSGMLAIPGLWGLFFAFRGRQTPGKRRMSLVVLDRAGGRASLGQHTLRGLFLTVELLPLPVPLGLVVMFTHSDGCRLGDMMAGTVVVRVAGEAAELGRGESAREVRVAVNDELTPARLARLTVPERALVADLKARVGLRVGVRRDLEQRLATYLADRLDLPEPLGDEAGVFLNELDQAL